MAKKNNDLNELIVLVLQVAGGILFSIFLLNSYLTFKRYSERYALKSADMRVCDSGNPLRFITVAIGWSVLLILSVIAFLGSVKGIHLSFQYAAVFICSCAGLIASLAGMFVVSMRIATTQIGVLVFKSKGTVVIPADPHNNTLENNIFRLKALKDLCSMEELPVSEISKVTRQGGTKVFIHGSFGARCVAWRDKQKRDECISALEMACGRRLSSMDLGQ